MFLNEEFTAPFKHPKCNGSEKNQVLSWFDRSSYHMLFRECAEGFLAPLGSWNSVSNRLSAAVAESSAW